MGVTNNIYLLSQSKIKKEDIERLETKVEGISKKLHQRIVEKNNNKAVSDIYELDEIKNLFEIEFDENDWFIGDEDFYFYEDKNGEFGIGEFAKDELEYNALCPECDYNLYDKMLKIITEIFLLKRPENQIRIPINEIEEGVRCPNCNLIIEKDILTGRKIIGNFRIELPHLLFEYMCWEEIVDYFNSNEKKGFYTEHYQYP